MIQTGSAITTGIGDFVVQRETVCPYSRATYYTVKYQGYPGSGNNRGAIYEIRPWHKRPDLFSVRNASSDAVFPPDTLLLRMEDGRLIDATARYLRGRIVDPPGQPWACHRQPDTFDGEAL